MSEDDLREYYQQVILDHSKRPRNFRELPEANRTAEGYNPLCGDKVRLFLVVQEEVIRDLSFQGFGCAISQASSSLLTEGLRGKASEEARNLFERVREMVTTGVIEEGGLGTLSVFAGVHQFPVRIKCAILPWHALIAALAGESEPVCTE